MNRDSPITFSVFDKPVIAVLLGIRFIDKRALEVLRKELKDTLFDSIATPTNVLLNKKDEERRQKTTLRGRVLYQDKIKNVYSRLRCNKALFESPTTDPDSG